MGTAFAGDREQGSLFNGRIHREWRKNDLEVKDWDGQLNIVCHYLLNSPCSLFNEQYCCPQ